MNPLKMVRDLHDVLNAEFDLVTSQIEELEKIDNEFAPLHIAILTDKYDTLVNRIYLLEKAIKKYTRMSMVYSDDTFLGLIEKLTDPQYAKALGTESELQRMAADKIGDKMLNIHQYEDGSIDPVILNWESAERMRANEDTR